MPDRFPSPEATLVIEHAHPSLRVDEKMLERLLRRIVREEGATLRALVVVLAGHETVLDLNQRYLSHDYLTDVLSFSLADEDDTAIEGEVYVDLDTAAERCGEFDTSFQDEAARYAAHGLLHLIGYEDSTAEKQRTMRALEDRYLNA